MYGSLVYPSNFMNFLRLKNDVVHNELEFRAKLDKSKTITIHLTKTMLP